LTNYYELLGVALEASFKEIKVAYHALILRYHPDLNQDDPEKAEAMVKKLNCAYEVLSDPERRSQYDQELFNGSSNVQLDLRVAFPVSMAVAFNGGKLPFSYVRTLMDAGVQSCTVENIVVDIPKRCRQGQTVWLTKQGNRRQFGDLLLSGDLFLTISYPRSCGKITVDLEGNVFDSISVPWVSVLNRSTYMYCPFPEKDGDLIKVPLDPQFESGHIYRIPGVGFGETSSYFVKIDYTLPSNLKEADRLALVNILEKY
jgi:DnaJ-class molecular chaperone